MLAVKEDVERLIPQKYPMAMVDGLLKNSETSTTSCLHIDNTNIFCSNGYFQEVGLIENMAQTAALKSGYEASLNKEKAAVGFIGSLKKIKIYKLPKVSDTLETTVEILHKLMNVSVIKTEVYCNGKLMAEGEMNIFLQDVKPRPKGRGNS